MQADTLPNRVASICRRPRVRQRNTVGAARLLHTPGLAGLAYSVVVAKHCWHGALLHTQQWMRKLRVE